MDLHASSKVELTEEVTDYLKKSFMNCWKEEDVEKKFSVLLERLAVPPMYSTLRLNTLRNTKEDIIAQVKTKVDKSYTDRGRIPPKIYPHPKVDEMIVIENRGPNLTIEKQENAVIVDQACGMAVLRGADVFVQGILGATTSLKKGDKVSVFADLEGKCLRGFIKPYTGKKIFLGNGISQYDRDSIFKTDQPLKGVGILMSEPLFEAPALNSLYPEVVFSQNLPSVICTCVLDPQPGERILDMCAAPGGKTCHVTSRMKNQGEVFALDKSKGKIDRIEENLQQWGLTCVRCHACDATRINFGQLDLQKNQFPEEYFDRILLDGPCSALGQRPCLKNKISLKSLKSYPDYQRMLIQKAVPLLKPGGVLVYSTCTITLEENEDQVVWMLTNFPQLKLIPQVPHIGGIGRKCDGLSEDHRTFLQLFDPSGQDLMSPATDTIGFFIAKFHKSFAGQIPVHVT